MKLKEIFIYPLVNRSGDNGEDYELCHYESSIIDDSKECGGSEEMKELLRERIDDLFNNDIEDYIDGVTDEDVEKCINDLAMGKDSNIKGEFFWWGDIKSVIVRDI